MLTWPENLPAQHYDLRQSVTAIQNQQETMKRFSSIIATWLTLALWESTQYL